MKKTISAILLIFAAIISFNIIHGYRYQKFVDKISKYQSNAELINTNGNSDIDSASFNLQEYFRLFDKLGLEPGYKLSCFYFNGFLYGRPVLLALKTGVSIDSLISAFKTVDPSLVNDFENDDIPYEFLTYASEHLNPVDHLIVEDSRMGYFQLLVFKIMGADYGLSGHATSSSIICTKPVALGVIRGLKSEGHGNRCFSKSPRLQFTLNGTCPVCRFKKNICTYEILQFRENAGFVRSKYIVSRTFPHQIMTVSSDTLVHYYCKDLL
jgi:hypothetical protein